MQRIAVCACLLAVILTGCASPAPRSDLGPPPPPVLSTRPPRPVLPSPPPEVQEPLAPPTTPAQTLRGATIVVDAGHGGEDPGARGRSALPEKTINLDIARELAQRLKERGANVLMTRSTDRFISLDGRAAFADRTHADLFVAIHADSARRASADGMTVYIGRGSSAQSRSAAQHIASALQRAGLEFRGVQTAGFRVLVAHSRPAVLIECGFLSNQAEARQLNNEAHRARIAQAIADGVAAYFAR
jgi:N-acetylmuramoyl-L-alanine amidase